MLHYLIELALLLLVAYLAGACVGCILRKLFGGAEAVAPSAPIESPRVEASAAPARATMAAPQPLARAPVVEPAPVPVVAAAPPPPPPPPPPAPVVAAAPRVVVPPPPPPPAPPPQRMAAPIPAAPRVTAPEAPRAAAPAPKAEAVALADTGKMERPKGIAAARGGKADDLQRISGIGPKNEKILHSLGFFHFDQIAAWTKQQVAWVDDHLRFNGRITREEWIKQARLLADGKDAEFTKLYGTGGLKNKQGEKLSGSRTRRS